MLYSKESSMRLKGTMGSRLRCWPTDLAPGQCKQLVKHVLWPLRGNGGPCHEHSAECGEALHSRWTRAGVDGALPPASRQARAAAAPRPCRRTMPAPRRRRRRCRACTTHSMLVSPPPPPGAAPAARRGPHVHSIRSCLASCPAGLCSLSGPAHIVITGIIPRGAQLSARAQAASAARRACWRCSSRRP